MPDFSVRSKLGELRAKFPRRNSAILLLASDKSNTHNNGATTSESETQSRPLSQCLPNGHRQSSSSEKSSHAPQSSGTGDDGGVGDGRSRSSGDGAPGVLASRSSSGGPATTLNTASEARDRLRQKETKQETSHTAKASADVRIAIVNSTDTDNDRNNHSLLQSDPQRAATAAAANSAPTSNDRTQNATNINPVANQPGTMHSAADTVPGHPDTNGNDQQALMANKLASIVEYSPNIDDSAIATNNTNSTPDAASNDISNPSPTSAVPAEPLRRIKLSDPPVNLPTTTATANANANYLDRSNSANLRLDPSISRPTGPSRRQSLLPSRQATLIRTLLSAAHVDDLDPASAEFLLPISANMVTRKIWVKRPGASATLITINEEDLVDDVREMILRKYANSLGRHFDAPDLTLRIAPREQQRQERLLGPEEPMARTLDAYYPGGQTVDEALIIDVPPRRTPRPSPRTGPPHAQHLTSVYFEDSRPPEAGTDYFGPEAMASHPASTSGVAPNGTAHPHTISVINTGQVPQIPSPGGTRSRPYRERPDRPRLGRQHTSSPTILSVVGTSGHPATIAVAANHDQSAGAPPPPPPALPTPPIQEATPVQIQRTATPPPRAASPRPPVPRPKKKKAISDQPVLPTVGLNGGVPPINVLIVEDNIINLRLLEAFVKRLKVRWQTAMNGREAVTKWRAGGFHLVLMDIQLPVMSGLEATREIRRLERMNSIGVFSSTPTPSPPSNDQKSKGEDASVDGENGDAAASSVGATASDEDILQNRSLFKSPVIIVALTASSLQSDRHEALAAGCNDFLTKPVTYVWLERKVMEWGCMQALIDFDGWRKWKAYSQNGEGDGDNSAAKKPKAKKGRPSQSSSEPQ